MLSALAGLPARSAKLAVTAIVFDIFLIIHTPSACNAISAPENVMSWAPLRSDSPVAQPPVQPNRDDDDESNKHLLDWLRHVEHHEAVEHHAHDDRADDGVADLAAAAE